MIYLIIALVLALAAAGFLGWRLYRAHQTLGQLEAHCRGLQQDRAIRENLQYLLEERTVEVKRLRGQVKRLLDQLEDLKQQTSELNLNLFHESGLRILREKEEGARRMKQDLMERQLDQANDTIRRLRQENNEAAARLGKVISEQREKIEELSDLAAKQQERADRVPTTQSRHARKTRDGLPNQVTLDDWLTASAEPQKDGE